MSYWDSQNQNMSENDTELQGLEKPEGEGTPEPTPAQPVAAKPSDYESWIGRAKRAEEALKKAQAELETARVQPSASVPDELRREIELTKLIAKGYNDEEAQFILQAGGLKNPYVQAGIEQARAKAKVGQAQPPASQVPAPSSPPTQLSRKSSASEKSDAWRKALDSAATRRGTGVV